MSINSFIRTQPCPFFYVLSVAVFVLHSRVEELRQGSHRAHKVKSITVWPKVCHSLEGAYSSHIRDRGLYLPLGSSHLSSASGLLVNSPSVHTPTVMFGLSQRGTIFQEGVA